MTDSSKVALIGKRLATVIRTPLVVHVRFYGLLSS